MTPSPPAAPTFSAPAPQAHAGLGRVPARRMLHGLGYALFGVLIFLIGFDFSQPSPYDYLAVPVILLWLALGIRLARDALPYVGLLLLYHIGLVFAVLPHFHRPDPVLWTAVSFYLFVTAIFFVMFFSEETEQRIELTLKAFLGSCLVVAAAGIAGYFDILGTGAIFTWEGRATGLFDDPNLLGSFLILGILYVVRNLLTGEARRPLLGLAALPVLLAGVFLSFSRGSWAATVIALAALLAFTFVTSPSLRVRRRIVALAFVTMTVGAVSVLGLLAIGEVRSTFEERAQLAQSYDEGVSGRFGRHLRSIPVLVEHPNGFGPLRYRTRYGADPHNSYIGSFANAGWLGGFAFIGLMLTTTIVGLRLSLRPSPYQRHAQILMAIHLTLLLQSLQIDIEHWRHVYLVWGMLWGTHVARLRWLARQRAASGWPAARMAPGAP
jgi:hypothetical protein